MTSTTALGVLRFSITSDRRSSSTRRSSLPKLARARGDNGTEEESEEFVRRIYEQRHTDLSSDRNGKTGR